MSRQILKAIEFKCIVAAMTLAVVACAGLASASAEDFNAGKTPEQLFASNCSGCHKSPRELNRDPRTLAPFLALHYTAGKEDADALTRYLLAYKDGPAPAANRAATRRRPNAEGEGTARVRSETPNEQNEQAAPPKRSRTTNAASKRTAAPKPEDGKAEPKSEAKPETKPE
jgi:mono/diheme cytochrome c family protein